MPPSPTTLERSVLIPAPAAAVWAALLDPATAPRWLGPFRFVTDGRVGGPFAVVGTLNGHDYAETGTLLAFEAGHLLRYDHWSPLWRVPDRPEHRAVLTLRLEPEEGGTRLHLRHALPAVEALAEHASFFWRGALESLRVLQTVSIDGSSPDAEKR